MPPAPRVNKATLDGFIGKPITLVGKVVSADASSITLSASVGAGRAGLAFRQRCHAPQLPPHAQDGPNVIATRPAGTAQPSPGQVLECLGTGTATGVETIRIVELGESFDLSKYELLVQAIHGKHKSLFM